MAKIELPTTLDVLRAMPFADRAALWAKYSPHPFKRQMRALWYYVQCDRQKLRIEPKFINQMTSGKGKRKIHYYATKGFYLTATCVDEIVVKTITQFLNSDMSNLPINLATVLKRIDVTNMNFVEKRNLIQSLVEKVVYSQEQLIYTITTDAQKLQPFIKENYVNQNTNKMEYVIGDTSITITEKVFLRKYVNTVYDRGKNGVLSVTDNHHLILKAFATAWKYRELYEQDGGVDNIIRNLHTSPRQFYRYLDIAYMNPGKINQILSGKLKINVNDLFQIARENQVTIL